MSASANGNANGNGELKRDRSPGARSTGSANGNGKRSPKKAKTGGSPKSSPAATPQGVEAPKFDADDATDGMSWTKDANMPGWFAHFESEWLFNPEQVVYFRV